MLVRANAAQNLAVYLRLLAALHTIGQHLTRLAYHQALRQQADLALAAAEKNITVGHEIERCGRVAGSWSQPWAKCKSPGTRPGLVK